MSDITFSQYQDQTGKTAVYPEEKPLQYLALGLNGEAGEAAEKIKKKERDGKEIDDNLLDELGDCIWYIARIIDELDGDFSKVAERNLEKLVDRKERSVIKGDGDNR